MGVQVDQGVLGMIERELYKVVGAFGAGDHIAEESCILDTPSAETVVADTFCKCVQLYGADLTAVMESFQPDPEPAACGGAASPAGALLRHCMNLEPARLGASWAWLHVVFGIDGRSEPGNYSLGPLLNRTSCRLAVGVPSA